MDAPIPRLLKILVVDDDIKFNEAVSLRLRRAGFVTESAANGKLALDAIEKGHYDLIVLDLVMPEMPGFEVLREMRKRGLQTRVVVLSLLRQEEDIRLVKELGASEYFIKSSPTFLEDIVKYAEQASVSA